MWALMSGMLRATYVSQVPHRFSLAVAEIPHTKLLFAKLLFTKLLFTKLSMHVYMYVCMYCLLVCVLSAGVI